MPETMTTDAINQARETVWRDIVRDDVYTSGIPGTLRRAIEWLQKHLDSVPEQYRDAAELRFDCRYLGEYGATPEIEISYCSPETDEEVARRLNMLAENREKKRNKLLRELNILDGGQ